MDVINEYQKEVADSDEEKIAQEKELALTYNRKLNQTVILSDPFDPNAISMADDCKKVNRNFCFGKTI